MSQLQSVEWAVEAEAGFAVEDRLPVAVERFPEDVLHQLGLLVTGAELVSAFGLPNVDPFGRAVVGSPEALCLAEGLPAR